MLFNCSHSYQIFPSLASVQDEADYFLLEFLKLLSVKELFLLLLILLLVFSLQDVISVVKILLLFLEDHLKFVLLKDLSEDIKGNNNAEHQVNVLRFGIFEIGLLPLIFEDY